MIVRPRLWIGKILWCGTASLGIALLGGMLSVVLKSLGDASAAEAVHGVTLVSLLLFALAVVTLVVILAFLELQRGDPPVGHD
ncbi:MAG: hypothetical protein JWP89_3866 [Schlesneria sp.]|nr:hypothetical protein [Schlesneria sp.]